MSKKKILMIHNYYQIGGGEHTVFENEKNLLQENGHEVFTYTRSNDELNHSKLKLLMMPFSTIWSVRTYREVRKLIREKQIDVVHCHNTFPLVSPSAYYAARSLKVPVVQTIHNFRFLCPNGLFYCDGKICEQCREAHSFLPALKKGCYRNSRIQTAVAAAMLTVHRWLGTYEKINYIFLTEFNRDKFSEMLDIRGENVFIKPNFVQAPIEKPETTEVRKKFIFAGRLDANKGVPFLLETWPKLPEEYELHIYGDGEYRKDCEKAAEQHKNIHYFGFCTQQKIFEDLDESAALLFPSELYEGYPMILTESFAVGKPVVSSALGNHGNVIQCSEGGCLFEVGNWESFAEALKEVISNHSAYAQKAYSYYLENLIPEKNYEKLCEIYDKAKHIC